MKVKCPTCGKELEWSKSNPYRPFCSERCKLIDLGAWLDEKMVIDDVDNNLNDGVVTIQDVLNTKNTTKKAEEQNN